MRHKIVAASLIVAFALLFGGSVALAQGPETPPKRMILTQLAEQLQLSADDVAEMKSQLEAGRSFKDVLTDYGITLDQIREAFGTLGMHDKGHRLSNTQIATMASKLGLDADEVASDLAAGKTPMQILREHDITPDQIHELFGNARHNHSRKPGKG